MRYFGVISFFISSVLRPFPTWMVFVFAYLLSMIAMLCLLMSEAAK